MTKPLIETKNLKKHFPVESGLLFKLLNRDSEKVRAVDGVDISINPGEIYGLVGESGCGKSTLGKTILQLEKPTAGEVWFDDERIDTLPDSELRDLRKRMQIVFQDPAASLNPRRTIRQILSRALDRHNITKTEDEKNQRINKLVTDVGLKPSHLDRYPHEFSGGQQQRIAIARALSVNPDFIVADEAVSSLDVNVQVQILNLIQELQQEYGLTILFIGHDLSVVKYVSDRLGVMYLGEIMEEGTSSEIFESYQHPYTEALVEAVPKIDFDDKNKRVPIEGEPPSAIDPPSGCPFRTRCPIAVDECKSDFEERKFTDTHRVNCIRRNPK